MSEREAQAAEKAYACCVHCKDAKEDHVENGGTVEKDRHDTSCPTCDRESAQFKAGFAAALAGVEKRLAETAGIEASCRKAVREYAAENLRKSPASQREDGPR